VKKIDTTKCIFALDGRSVDNIVEEFLVTHGRFPSLKMYLCDRLDDATGISLLVKAKSEAAADHIFFLSKDEMLAFSATSAHYEFRTNDVFFYLGETDQQSIVYSCCGSLEIGD